MHLKLVKWPVLLLVVSLLCACAAPPLSQSPPTSPDAETIVVQDLDITTGQTIYVPAYSEIYHASGGRTLDLAVTLSIHNTDLEHPIVLTSVRYYASNGGLLTEYLDSPQRLGPMASTDFFVDADEQSGGVGTNFLVDWVAEQAVYEPVVEALMLSTTSAQGISFSSPGRVVSQVEP